MDHSPEEERESERNAGKEGAMLCHLPVPVSSSAGEFGDGESQKSHAKTSDNTVTGDKAKP